MKNQQTHMFPSGADLPLFSETAPRGWEEAFVPVARVQPPEQLPLFELAEEEEQAKRCFKCPYCGYECNWAALGGEYDCPLCGDN